MKRFALFILLASAIGVGSAFAEDSSSGSPTEWQPADSHEQKADVDHSQSASSGSRSADRSNDSSGSHESNRDSSRDSGRESSHDSGHDSGHDSNDD